MSQPRREERGRTLAVDFAKRIEPNVALGNALAAHLALPALVGLWPGGAVSPGMDQLHELADISGNGRGLANRNGATFGYWQLVPYVHMSDTSQQYFAGPARQPRRRYTVITPASSPYTPDEMDEIIYCDTTTGNIVVTPPTPGNINWDQVAWELLIMNVGVNGVTVTPTASTINGVASWPLPNQYDAIHICDDSLNWFVMAVMP